MSRRSKGGFWGWCEPATNGEKLGIRSPAFLCSHLWWRTATRPVRAPITPVSVAKIGIMTVFHHQAATSLLRVFSSSMARRIINLPLLLRKGRPNAPSSPSQASFSSMEGKSMLNFHASAIMLMDLKRSHSLIVSRTLPIISLSTSASFSGLSAYCCFSASCSTWISLSRASNSSLGIKNGLAFMASLLMES
jgi:hypothetical protein